jgi:hypothetical protein
MHGRNVPIMTHLFVSLEDDASAILLDVVNFVYRAMRQLSQETRLIIHIAIPDSLFNGDPRAAKHYAALRELERFTISYGDTMHVIYPPGSGLEDFNVPSSLLIFGVKLYPSRAMWADILLPQLDSSETGFAPHYLQINVANWNAWRDHQIERTGNRYSLYAGSYTTHTALFPVELLRRSWSARLAFEIFAEWLGGFSIDVENLWKIRYSSTGETVSFPRVTDWLLGGNSLPIRAIDSAEDAYNILFKSERSSAFLNSLYEECRSDLDWLPTSEAFPYASAADLFKQVEEAFIEHLGGLNITANSLPESSLYQEAILKIVDAQHQRFIASLNAFLLEMLHGQPGIYGVLDFLQESLVKPLEKASVRLHDESRVRIKQLSTEEMHESLARSARRVPSQRRRFGISVGEATERYDFFERAQRAAKQIKAYYAFAALADLAQRFYETSRRQLAALSAWRGELQTFLSRAKAAQITPDWSETPDRFWLVDSAWSEAVYQQLKAEHGRHLLSCLRWSLEAGQANLMLNNQVINFESWLKNARESVQNLRLSLWGDYLQDRYHALLPSLRTFFDTNRRAPWYKDAFIESEVLIVPSGLPDDLATPLRTHLKQTHLLREADLLNHDPTRIVLFTAAEVFPLGQINGIDRVQAAYRALNPQQRARLHVLPADVEAIEWEARARDQMNLDINFSGSVIALFANRSAMQQFVRLEALGLIRRIEYDKSGYGFALVIDGQYWWLARNERLAAITNFIFDDTPRPFGKPPTIGESFLPRADFEKSIHQTIVELANQRDDAYPDTALTRVVEMLDHRAQMREWTRLQAEEASALLLYHRHMLQSEHGKNRDERDLSIALALIAKVLYDHTLATLRSRVY